MGERKYCKNKTPGSHPGQKWDQATRTGVLMDMIRTGNICAVARKWGVPESTIRTWIAKETKKPGGFYEKARREYAQQLAAKAVGDALEMLGYLGERVKANRANAEICENLRGRLREDARARSWEVGKLLATEEERRAAAQCTDLVVYSAPGTFDRQLSDEERKRIKKQLKLHAPMDDRTAAALAQTLVNIAARAAALGTAPAEEEPQSAAEPPLVYIASLAEEEGKDVILDE